MRTLTTPDGSGTPPRTPWFRRTALAAAVALLSVGLLAPAAAAQSDGGESGDGSDGGVRTEAPGLRGYSLSASASPVSIELYDKTVPIPVDPGEPQFAISVSHTSATIDSGPLARALASSVWPGAGIGDGFSQVCECDQTYPVKVEANFNASTTEPQTASQGGPNGSFGMEAVSRGLDTVATATAGSSPGPTMVDYGQVHSTSHTRVVDGEAIATVDTSIADLQLAGGLISIDNLHTTLRAVSDGGETTTTSGSTQIDGLNILGAGFTLDQKGLHAVGGDGPLSNILPSGEGPGGSLLGGEGPLGGLLGQDGVPSSAGAALEPLGITVRPLQHTTSTEEGSAERSASGVRISLDTKPLRTALDALSLNDVVSSMPNDQATSELKSQLFFVLGLEPRIDIVIGSGSVLAGATQPLQLDTGANVSPPGGTGTGSVGGTGTSGTAPVGGSVGSPSGAGTGATGGSGSAPAPQVAAPGTNGGGSTPTSEPAPAVAQPAATQVPPLYGGISPAALALGLLLVGGGAWGLRRATGVVMAGGVGGCSEGHDTELTDLRT